MNEIIDFTKSYLGEFWLPKMAEKKIPGILNFKDEKFHLHLLKELEHWSDHIHMHDIILGFIPSIGKITLYKCLIKNQEGYRLSENEKDLASFIYATNYRPYFLLIGHHFKKPEEIQFNSISLKYSTLHEWIRKSSLKSESDYYSIALEKPKKKEIIIDQDLTINLTIGDIRQKYSIPKIEIFIDSFFTLNMKSNIHLNEIIKNCRILKEFLQFMTNKTPKLINMSFKNNLDESPREIYFLTNPSLKSDLVSDNIFIEFSAIEEEFEKILQRWFIKREELKSTFIQFFSVEYNPGFYIETKFLYYVQILEGYHRRRMKENANLELRLKEILNKYNQFSVDIFSSKSERNKFVKNVRTNRDHMSHSLKKETISFDDEFVTEANDILKVFIVLCFLDELGIPLDFANKLIKQLKSKKQFII